MKFLQLDLDRFLFFPMHNLGPIDEARAKYTIERLRLNDRDILPEARREAFGAYGARLFRYSRTREESQRTALRASIMNCSHPTVWLEMKRQAHRVAKLKELFEAVPEAHWW